MAELTGGCLCGRVRYVASGEPVFAGVCHCHDCQRSTGSAFQPVMAFAAQAVSLTGALQTYQGTGDSGGAVFRRFCPGCGSHMAHEVEVMPGFVMILAGTLDDPKAFQPTMEIYCDSAQPWVHLGGERARFGKMPPSA